HGSFYYESEDCKVWGGLFSCISRGPFALQESEITEVMWMSLDEINQRRREITPDTRVALDLWLNRNG
ncbi:MAG TPA: NUDIX hydrolase, partial [Plesiomonas shigelloides]|nr:NUDIX hydrolase [Plesiomonas shigelloides]